MGTGTIRVWVWVWVWVWVRVRARVRVRVRVRVSVGGVGVRGEPYHVRVFGSGKRVSFELRSSDMRTIWLGVGVGVRG